MTIETQMKLICEEKQYIWWVKSGSYHFNRIDIKNRIYENINCVYCCKKIQQQNKWIIKSDGTIILLHAIINAVTAGKVLKCHKASWFWNMVILISSISYANIDTLLRLKRFESLLGFVDRCVASFGF